ncbi:MAG: ABC transporter permease [Tepidiformaceae bacterium]
MAQDSSTLAQPFDFAREQIHTKQRGLWSQALQRLLRNRLAFAAGVILLILLTVSLAAEFTDVVARHDPATQQYTNTNSEPTSEFWLGTDTLGRDVWARTLSATLFSLKIGVGAETIVLIIGLSVGIASALGGKVTDGILMWITDLAYAFPDLLAIILLRQLLFGRDWPIIGTADPQIPGLPGYLIITILAISFVSWVTVARLVRGQMLSLREQDYILAARAIGATQGRVVRSHMLPNTLSTVIVAVTFGIPTRIFAEASLAFIGLGVPPPASSLGSLITDGYDHLQENNLLVVWPAIMVATLMLCFTFLGDGLRDALDPRTRK